MTADMLAVRRTLAAAIVIRSPAAQRFWTKVQVSEGCWLWMGAKNPKGYGLFGESSTNIVVASRFAYADAVGPIPPGMYVCHRCDNPGCVRPDHLFVGTPSDNARDMHAKGRAPKTLRRRTHCKRGHPLEGDNVSTCGTSRTCRICLNAGQRTRRARRTAARASC